jgi:hypothetical protein
MVQTVIRYNQDIKRILHMADDFTEEADAFLS